MSELNLPMIEINDLSYSYPDNREALHDIHLKIQSGEKVGIIGPNGAGKSTLIFHLNGILKSDGKIKINGLHLSRENLKRIRSMVGIVFQNPDDQLFSQTVLEDVAYGPIYQGLKEEEVPRRVKQALHAVHMDEFEERAPFHLSIGEKKRIAIATVLSMNPEILVFDEPSAGLDPKARRELIELLDEYHQTMIIASHELDLIKQLTERTIVLAGGKVKADGVTQEILSDQDILNENGLV